MQKIKSLGMSIVIALAFVVAGCSNTSTTTYYTVMFETNGGSSVTSQFVESGKTATKPTAPTREPAEDTTYSFAGWYSDSALTAAFNFATPINANITLYAKWIEIQESDLKFTGTDYTELAAGTDGTAGTSATYVLFGDWPQTVKADTVTVDEYTTRTQGAYTYYKGSDDAWYYPCSFYSDEGEHKSSWFKLEPIKWRLLTDDNTGKKILFAENILTNCAYYDYDDVYRTIEKETVYPSNYQHSRIRAFLNGIPYQKSDDAEESENKEFFDKGFLQTAFTSALQEKIVTATVDNSAEGSNTASNASEWNDGKNEYVCADTSDKIFLLSEKEVTSSDFNFEAYDSYGTGNARIRMATDYAKANGAYQNSTEGYGGWYWLRSPYYNNNYCAYYVTSIGHANDTARVNRHIMGIVPALCID